MQQAGLWTKKSHDLQYHVYQILVQSILKDIIVLACGRSLSFLRVVNQKVMRPGSVHLSPPGSECRDPKYEGRDDDNIKKYNGIRCRSALKL